MSLDKWIKDEEEEEKKKEEQKPQKVKEKEQKPSSEEEEGQEKKKTTEQKTSKLSKYTLKCPNKKCKYQKTIMKTTLTSKDKTCPRCNSKMKVN